MNPRSITRSMILLGVGAFACSNASEEKTAASRGALAPVDWGDPGDPGDPPPPPPPPGPPPGSPCTNPTVVYFSSNGDTLCSGVVVASDVIVTAAHCLYRGTNAFIEPSQLTVGQAANSCKVGDTRVLNYEVNPDYDENGNPDDDQNAGRDLAVMRLASPIAGAQIATVSSNPAPLGAAVTGIGYGFHPMPNATNGAPYCYSGTIQTRNQGYFTVNQSLGGGNSGGPVFLSGTNTLVGTIARGDDLWLFDRPGIFGASSDASYLAAAIARVRNAAPQLCTTGATTPCKPDGAACLSLGAREVRGACHYGTATCNAQRQFGECVGYVGPTAEVCHNGVDDDCDGSVDEDCTSGGGGTSGSGGYGGGPTCSPCPSMGCYVDYSCGFAISCMGSCQPGFQCISGECYPETIYF